MKDSIIQSALRAFLIALFTVIGGCLAILLIIFGMSAFNTSTSTEPTKDFNIEVLANAEGKREAFSNQPVILKININGIVGLDKLDQHHISQMLIQSREGILKNNLVKGILLHIQTPGGTVTDADGIYRTLKAYKHQYNVPIYAFVDGMCASGGMYIAAAADRVLATDTSIIGSIGVIAPSVLNISQLLEKLGIQSLTLYAGKGKDGLNPLRPWHAGEENNYRELIDYYYNEFVNIMTANRPQLDKTKLIQEYGAKIFPAQQAKELGYIDESGVTLNEAISQLARQMSIEGPNYRVVQMQKETWISEIFKTQLKALNGSIKHELQISPAYDPRLLGQFQYMFRP